MSSRMYLLDYKSHHLQITKLLSILDLIQHNGWSIYNIDFFLFWDYRRKECGGFYQNKVERKVMMIIYYFSWRQFNCWGHEWEVCFVFRFCGFPTASNYSMWKENAELNGPLVLSSIIFLTILSLHDMFYSN